MSISPSRYPWRIAFGLCSAVVCGLAQAQTTPPASSQGTNPMADVSPSERAKRDAEKVFQWIRIHSDKPRKSAAAKDDKPATTASAAPVAKTTGKSAKTADASHGEPIRETTAAVVVLPTAPQPLAAPSVKSDAAANALVAAVPPAAIEDTDAALIPVHRTDPEFPTGLMRSLRKGMVQVSFTVQPDGSVAQAQAVSTTHARLNQAAIATVSQWRFQPLRHAQHAVVDLGFNLD